MLLMINMRKQILTISVDQTILELLDAERGLIKRSTWINEALKKLLTSAITPPRINDVKSPLVVESQHVSRNVTRLK